MKKHSNGSVVSAGILTSYVVMVVFIGLANILNAASYGGMLGAIATAILTPVFIIAVSVICTGGVGLVFWICVWILAGTIFYMIYDNFAHKGEEDINKDISIQIVAVKNYIIDAKKFGMDDDLIKANLFKKGWKYNDIEKAYSLI